MNTKLSSVFLGFLVTAHISEGADLPQELLLWPSGAPGSKEKSELADKGSNGERRVWAVHQPSITPYLPEKEKATGAAVLVIPGGGHRMLAIDHEGYNVARWLENRGIAAFVLKYRLARATNSSYKIDEHALADTQRAIRVVRSRAAEWHIDPARVGVMGFSAGGELAFLSGMRFDKGGEEATDSIERQSSRPDFQALIYPGSTHRIEVTKETPPAFLACAYNDRPDISEGLANVYLLFKKAGVPAELHIYATGGHGFGLRASAKNAAASWPDRFEAWLRDSFLRK